MEGVMHMQQGKDFSVDNGGEQKLTNESPFELVPGDDFLSAAASNLPHRTILDGPGKEEQYALDCAPHFLNQNYYLVDGHLREHYGSKEAVNSAIVVDGQPLPLGSYPVLDKEQALEVLDAAVLAFDRGLGEWPQMSPGERIACMEHFIASMQDKREEVVSLLVYEIGKTYRDAENEFDRTVAYMRKTIHAYQEMQAEHRVSEGWDLTLDRAPIGVTLCMGPFNYPLNETLTNMVPAILTGNTLVLKPARYGVLLFEPLLDAMKDSFPPGVVNLLYGDGAEVITPIMESGKVDTLAFIGSTKVADILTKSHPTPHKLKRILGLGAHNPCVVMEGSDIESIIPEIVAGSLSFNGQRCTTLAHHCVHESKGLVYAEKLAEEVSKLVVGLPTTPGVDITPLVEGESKINYLQSLIEDAVSKGARIMNDGGGRAKDNLMTPAVLFPVTPEMRIFSEEQFGPIVPISTYRDEREVLQIMAESDVGQQMSVFGPENEELQSLVKSARTLVSRININTRSQRGPDDVPFTGRKGSALGTISIQDALEAFTIPSVVASK